jgi:type IV secretory pathway component VirB8
MKSKLITGFFFLQFFLACTNPGNTSSESDVDAARNFIRASLDNDFKKARTYMLQDSLNNEFLDAIERSRANLPKEENKKYNEASIRIFDTQNLNDSVSIISYANSYKNTRNSLKVVKNNMQWLVDFKYSFPADSSYAK